MKFNPRENWNLHIWKSCSVPAVYFGLNRLFSKHATFIPRTYLVMFAAGTTDGFYLYFMHGEDNSDVDLAYYLFKNVYGFNK